MAAALLVWVLCALWHGLFLAVVLAALLWPLHRRLSTLLKGRRPLAAGVVIITAGVQAGAAFAELKDPVRDRLQRYGLQARIGRGFFFRPLRWR